jgi:HD-GYP domain-containing protein (c-di-GMP phosphodiesterase class II)
LIQVELAELTLDHKLARSVFRPSGEMLLAAGYQLTPAVLKRIPEIKQNVFWVIQEDIDEIVLEETVSEHICMQSIKNLTQNANHMRKELKSNQKSIQDIRADMKDTGKFRNIITIDSIQNSATTMIAEIMRNDAAMINLSGIRNQSNYVFQHSIESTIVAIMLGNKFGFNKYELEELALGCLLMDTGYLVMPERLVNSPKRINFQEYCLLKEHPNYGYTILKENPKLPLISAHVAYQHHERQDGGGYPRRLKGHNSPPVKKSATQKRIIHRYAEIAAVAETYIELNSPRPHLPKKSPEEIIKLLIKAAGNELNQAIVDTLITLIPIYPAGSRIIIIRAPDTKLIGCLGVVAKTNFKNYSLPTIYVTHNKNKNRISPKKINLQDHPEIKIQFKVLGSR